jgi:hypothetical protein
VQHVADVQTGKTWRVALGTRIVMGFLAAFMFGIAGLLVSLPFTLGGADHTGDWMVFATALVVAGFGVFITFASVAIARTRLTLDATTLDATVVDGHNWFLVPRFRSIRVPLHDIQSIERRNEIFKTLGMRDALSIVTSGGERIGLFSNTLGSLDTLPLDEVANAIAAAAGIGVTDDGTVLTRGSGLYGAASSTWTERPLDPTSANKARRTAIVAAQICSALVLLTYVLRAFFH